MLTWRDLDDVPDDLNRYEVIDGELHVTPFPGYAHQHTLDELNWVVEGHVRAKKLGRVFQPGTKVVLAEPTGVGPDIVFISNERMQFMQDDGFHGVPDLVVEIPSTKPNLDRIVKKRAYEAAGVPHYWIADPKKRLLEAFRLEAGRYVEEARIAGKGTYRPSLLPGLEIDVATLWP